MGVVGSICCTPLTEIARAEEQHTASAGAATAPQWPISGPLRIENPWPVRWYVVQGARDELCPAVRKDRTTLHRSLRNSRHDLSVNTIGEERPAGVSPDAWRAHSEGQSITRCVCAIRASASVANWQYSSLVCRARLPAIFDPQLIFGPFCANMGLHMGVKWATRRRRAGAALRFRAPIFDDLHV